jgi:CRISPR-associated endonuclease Csn1
LEDEENVILHKAMTEWGLDRAAAEAVCIVDLPSGYASFSRIALEKLRPQLERGLPLMTRDNTPSALSVAGYLRPDQRVVNQKDFLPAPPPITNPLVRQALHEVRRLVNAIIREFGRPARINIELAREVKGTAKDRARRSKEMRDREHDRDGAAEEIRKLGITVTRDAIDRYLLWEEQRRECVYSGRSISQAQLFGGEIDVDHVLPRVRSLDNSWMNRALCFRSENADKKDQTPWEWLAETNPNKYEAVLQRTRHKDYPYPKAQRFRQQHVELEDFLAHQFVDTTYLTTQVHEYVRCLGADVNCSKGTHTADLRRHWGLNTVLRADERDQKNRDDHRHHAVDAIVIALTSRSRLQQLSALYRRGRPKDEVLPEPWTRFRDAVEQAVNGINVSHRVQRRARGSLHDETFYGPTAKTPEQPSSDRPWAKDWVEDEGIYVRRKPIEELKNTKHLRKVRDKTIRAILEAHVRARGIDPESNTAISATVWKDIPRMPSGIPIRRVRLLEEGETFRQLRPSVFVKPGGNHHIAYRRDGVDLAAPWKAEVVTRWDAAERARLGKPVIDRTDRPDQPFIMSLAIGEAFLIEDQDRTLLCIMRKIDQRSKRVHYKYHTDARVAGEIDKLNLYASPKKMKELDARKVTIDLLGRLRWAND